MNSKTTTPGTLHLLCGLPGAGKSTFAQKLEIETRGVVLNHDLWLIGIFGESAEAAWARVLVPCSGPCFGPCFGTCFGTY